MLKVLYASDAHLNKCIFKKKILTYRINNNIYIRFLINKILHQISQLSFRLLPNEIDRLNHSGIVFNETDTIIKSKFLRYK